MRGLMAGLTSSADCRSRSTLVHEVVQFHQFGRGLLPSRVLLSPPIAFMAIFQLFHEQLEEAILPRCVKFRPTHVFGKLAVTHLLYLLVHALNASVEHRASKEGLDHLTL
jgi:hypothetical protein